MKRDGSGTSTPGTENGENRPVRLTIVPLERRHCDWWHRVQKLIQPPKSPQSPLGRQANGHI